MHIFFIYLNGQIILLSKRDGILLSLMSHIIIQWQLESQNLCPIFFFIIRDKTVLNSFTKCFVCCIIWIKLKHGCLKTIIPFLFIEDFIEHPILLGLQKLENTVYMLYSLQFLLKRTSVSFYFSYKMLKFKQLLRYFLWLANTRAYEVATNNEQKN